MPYLLGGQKQQSKPGFFDGTAHGLLPMPLYSCILTQQSPLAYLDHCT